MIKNIENNENKIKAKRADLILRFVYFRNRSNLSAKALSEMLGNSKGYIAKFEQGNLNMPMDKLLECVEIFGVSVEEFFSENYQNLQEEKKFVSKYHKLSKENKELILKIMDALK